MPPNPGPNVAAPPCDERRLGARTIRHGRFGQVWKGSMDEFLHSHGPIGVCRVGLYPKPRSDVKTFHEIEQAILFMHFRVPAASRPVLVASVGRDQAVTLQHGCRTSP